MLKTIIIDDDKQDIQYLKQHIDVIDVKKVFHNNQFTYDEIQSLHADLIFMNIHSPTCISVELLQMIANNQLPIHTVFIASSQEVERRKKSSESIHYITKPFKMEEILTLKERLSTLQEDHPRSRVQICMFKYFHFKNENEKYYNVKWRTAKSKELLVYFIQHYKEIIRKDVLAELLWPDVQAEKAYDNLYATIYYLRKLLKDLDIGIKINNTVHGYEIELDEVTCDIILFEELIEEIEHHFLIQTDKEVILQAFKKLQALYTGEYLEEESYVWKEHTKEKYGVKFLALAQKMIEYLIAHEEYTDAILLALHIQRLYPYMDYSYFTLMRLYDQFGDPYNVEKQYVKLKEMLEEEFSAQPNKEVKKWYQAWMKKQYA